MTAARIVILVAGKAARALELDKSLLALHSPVFLETDSATEALVLAGRHRPRLAILSRDLADGSGEELSRALRAEAGLRSTSVMLLDPRGEAKGRVPGANVTVDGSGEQDREAIVTLADRLLSISPRAKTRAAVCLGRERRGQTVAVFAQALDISESGMLVECGEELALGEELSLHFVLPGMPDLVMGKAKVIRKGSGRAARKKVFGLEFTSLLPRHQLKIRRFLREHSAAG